MLLPFKGKPRRNGDSYIVTVPMAYFTWGLLDLKEELNFTVESKKDGDGGCDGSQKQAG